MPFGLTGTISPLAPMAYEEEDPTLLNPMDGAKDDFKFVGGAKDAWKFASGLLLLMARIDAVNATSLL